MSLKNQQLLMPCFLCDIRMAVPGTGLCVMCDLDLPAMVPDYYEVSGD
jgi:hypothetical protein